jgi:DedD protein
MNDALDPILQQETQRKLKVQLAWRLGIASVLIVLALFGINWLDRQQDTPPAVNTPTPRIAPATAEPLPLPTTAPTTAPAAASTPAEASATLSITSAPSSDSGVIEGAQRSAPKKAVTTPAPATVAPTATPATPAPAAAPAPAKVAPLTTPAKTIAATPAAPVRAPAAMTATPRALPAAPVTISPLPYPAPQQTPQGYIVQAGVFLQTPKAENYLLQLKTAGIPAYIESRVQIGPFKDKAAAEAAVQKLRQLGIEPVVRK